MVFAYMRQVPNVENIVIQKNSILTFAHQNQIILDQEVFEYASKDLLIEERKDFENFLKSLEKGRYTVVVSSLSVLSTRVDELVKIINCILSHDVDLWIADVHLCINKDTAMSKIFPLLESQRTKLNTKTLTGRPKGSKSSSKFDVYHSIIMKQLSQNQSVSAIARDLGVSRSSLKDYIKSRELKTLVNSLGDIVEKLSDMEIDNVVLICPFKAKQHLKNIKE